MPATVVSKHTAFAAALVLFQLILLLLFFDFFTGYLLRDDASVAPGNAWLFCLLIAGGYVRYTLRVVPGVRARALDFSPIKLLAVPIALLAGVVEEVGLRAALMDYAAAAGLSVGWQIAASAVLFALIHSLWVILTRDFKSLPRVLISTAVLGGCLAVLYLSGGRNVWPCVLAHVLIVLALEPWRLLSPEDRSTGEITANP